MPTIFIAKLTSSIMLTLGIDQVFYLALPSLIDTMCRYCSRSAMLKCDLAIALAYSQYCIIALHLILGESEKR